MTNATAKSIYETVKGLGITRAQARKLLPSWWSPDVEGEPGGIDELMVLLSRRLSLDLKALSDGQLVSRGAVSKVAFKRQANLDPTSISSASHVASSIAALVCSAMSESHAALPKRADFIQRDAIAGSNRLVGFDALLKLCWKLGIPVIPLVHLPVGMRKMDGAAMLVAGRPVIILAKKHSSRAWLSFILAHEIAHIALGHIDKGSIVDISLQEESTLATGVSSDSIEDEADAFALAVLGGGPAEAEVARWPNRLAPAEIAVRARHASLKLRVEAGNLVLRYAFATRAWPAATMALNFLPEDSDANKALADALVANVDLERLGEDAQEFLHQVTGLEVLT